MLRFFVNNYNNSLLYRYSSRVVMIPFVLPRIGTTDEGSFKAFQNLQNHIKKVSSLAGAVVSLEQDFIKDQLARHQTRGNQQKDDEICGLHKITCLYWVIDNTLFYSTG